MVDIFRASQFVLPYRGSAWLKVRPSVIWMQLGIRDAARLAATAGAKVAGTAAPRSNTDDSPIS
jgi:predicted CoA-binding protein